MTTMMSARTILTLLVPLLAGTHMPLHAQAAGDKPEQAAPAPSASAGDASGGHEACTGS